MRTSTGSSSAPGSPRSSERRLVLNLLEATHPVFHLIVYPDGSTNQPRPKTESQHGPISDTLFDLAVGRTEISHGLLLLNQRAIPFDLTANDLAATITYDATRDHYLPDLQANDIPAQRAMRPAVRSKLSLSADFSRNNAVLSQFKLQTGESLKQGSLLEASGTLSNYADPEIELTAQGSIDVREVDALTAVPGLEGGIVELQIQSKGNVRNFAVDGQAKVTGAAYRLPEVRVSGVTGSTNIHITQDEISLTSMKARLPEGGSLEGELHLVNWLAPTPATPTREQTVAAVAKKSQNLPAPPTGQVITGNIRAQIRDVTLRSVLKIVAPESFDDLGFEAAASGPVSVQWSGNASDLQVAANVTLAAGNGANGVPLSGVVDATYYNRRGAVDIRRLVAQTPGSHVEAQGSLGVYPLERESQVNVDVTTSNLGEFDKTLRALGVSTNGEGGRKTGVQAIPVALHGRAEFHGTVTGSLARPDVKGHLTATDFDTVFTTAPQPPAQSDVSAAAAPHKPGPEAPAAAPVTNIHWDSLDTHAEYSLDLISVEQATLTRGKTTIHTSGRLQAHETAHHHSTFDDESGIAATVSIQNAPVADLLTIAGSTAPVSGTLSLDSHVGGTLGNLSGGGHLAVQGGQIYGEAYRSLNSDLRFAGHDLDATNLKFLQDGGQISGDGGYDTHAKTVHFVARAAAASNLCASSRDSAAESLRSRPTELSGERLGAGSDPCDPGDPACRQAGREQPIPGKFGREGPAPAPPADIRGKVERRRSAVPVGGSDDAYRQLPDAGKAYGDPGAYRALPAQVQYARHLERFHPQPERRSERPGAAA